MFLDRYAPKKFLFRYSLEFGSLCVSALMICICVISGIAVLVQILMYDSCWQCSQYVWKNSFGFSVTAMVYTVIMLAIHIWLIFGIRQKKTSIVLSWVVVTSMWLALTFCLLIVLICMHSKETNFVAWILCLVFGLIAIGILLYAVLVVYGYWLELKKTNSLQVATTPAS